MAQLCGPLVGHKWFPNPSYPNTEQEKVKLFRYSYKQLAHYQDGPGCTFHFGTVLYYSSNKHRCKTNDLEILSGGIFRLYPRDP